MGLGANVGMFAVVPFLGARAQSKQAAVELKLLSFAARAAVIRGPVCLSYFPPINERFAVRTCLRF